MKLERNVQQNIGKVRPDFGDLKENIIRRQQKSSIAAN
jgi:hypothetical protein